MIGLARQYGSYGDRRVALLLREAGWQVSYDLLISVVFAKPLLRPETRLRRKRCQLRATRVAATSKQHFFPTCYGPEFVAKDVRAWIEAVGARAAFIEPGSPGENGYVEDFNARFRDALLDRDIFYALREAQIIIEGWGKHYNTKRPHSALEIGRAHV